MRSGPHAAPLVPARLQSRDCSRFTSQLRFGFEGVAVDNGVAIVAFQRKWDNEPNPRIGMYNMTTKTWTFVYYPLDAPESQNGGWVRHFHDTPMALPRHFHDTCMTLP